MDTMKFDEEINDILIEGRAGLPRLVGKLKTNFGKRAVKVRARDVIAKRYPLTKGADADTYIKASRKRAFDKQPILMRHPKYPGEKGRFWS
jgi:hypothetical protein